MAANKQQGRWLGAFLIGITLACAGILGFSSGLGKVALLVGVVFLAGSLFKFMAIKPLEGKVALGAQPAAMKLIGVLVVVGGWCAATFGVHLTSSVGGRMTLAIVGLLISLAGICIVLPAACNKNAIWKA